MSLYTKSDLRAEMNELIKICNCETCRYSLYNMANYIMTKQTFTMKYDGAHVIIMKD